MRATEIVQRREQFQAWASRRPHPATVAQRASTDTAGWIGDDERASAGEVSRRELIAALRRRVQSAADASLASIGQTSEDCPYIAYWFEHFQSKDARSLERAIRAYAPETAQATTWQERVDLVVDRVRTGFEAHLATGSLSAVPDGVPRDLDQASQKSAQRCQPKKSSRARLLRNAADDGARFDLLKGARNGAVARMSDGEFNDYLRGCTAAVAAIGAYMAIDVDRDQADQTTNYDTFAQFRNDLENRASCFCRCVNRGGVAHEWTVIKVDGRYDLYESDENDGQNRIHVFGYQGMSQGQTARSLTAQGLVGQLNGMAPRLGNGAHFDAHFYSLDVPLAR